jgi:hypothetical protein
MSPKIPRKTTISTIASPIKPALFLLNLRHATAHWLADLLLYVLGFPLSVSVADSPRLFLFSDQRKRKRYL